MGEFAGRANRHNKKTTESSRSVWDGGQICSVFNQPRWSYHLFECCFQNDLIFYVFQDDLTSVNKLWQSQSFKTWIILKFTNRIEWCKFTIWCSVRWSLKLFSQIEITETAVYPILGSPEMWCGNDSKVIQHSTAQERDNPIKMVELISQSWDAVGLFIINSQT